MVPTASFLEEDIEKSFICSSNIFAEMLPYIWFYTRPTLGKEELSLHRASLIMGKGWMEVTRQLYSMESIHVIK